MEIGRRSACPGAWRTWPRLETILFRQRSYEAITRLKANPDELADDQREAHEWAEVDVGAHE